MTILLMQAAPRRWSRLHPAALLLALTLLPCAQAADNFSVRATLTPAPSEQTSGNFVLSGSLGRPHAGPVLHSGSTFGLAATLSPLLPLTCYSDTIFRDGFGYP